MKPSPDDIVAVLCAIYWKCRKGRAVTECHLPPEFIQRVSRLPGDRFRTALRAMTGRRAARILRVHVANMAGHDIANEIPDEPLLYEKPHGGKPSYGLTRIGAMIAVITCSGD